jgi:uncharacterized membrane protein
MPSPSETLRGPAPRAFALALLIASSLQIMENLLPRFPLFPWMRIGLSYVVILPFLLQYGPRAAFALFLARNLIAVLYGGQPLTTFLIGSGSGAAAFLGAGAPVAWAYHRGWMGILGASIVMATAFNLAQLAVVNLTLIRHSGFYFQTGPILAWSLASGAAVALLIRFSYAELAGLFSPNPTDAGRPDRDRIPMPTQADVQATLGTSVQTPLPASTPATLHAARSSTRAMPERSGATKPGTRSREFLVGLALLALLAALPPLWMQVPAFALLLVLVRDRLRMLWHAWPFFFYLAWLHLFHTSGTYWIGESITHEGARNFAIYSVRLANLILLGRWLSLRFPWQWMANPRSAYLQGLLLALPLLPDLFRASLELGGRMLRGMLRGQRTGVLAPAFEAWKGRMAEAAREAGG